MSLKLPIYLIVGEKPVSVEATPDGGMRLLGWDFSRGVMTRDVTWDEVVGHLQEGLKVRRNTRFADGGDTFAVTKEEFDRRVEELSGGHAEAGPPVTIGVPEPLTPRRTLIADSMRALNPDSGTEVSVSQFERSIRAECCDGDEKPEPEEDQKLRGVVRDIYGDDSPTR